MNRHENFFESSRSVSSDAVGRCLCSPFPPGFPAVPHHLNHTSVVTDPSQNRTCGFAASGSSGRFTYLRHKSKSNLSLSWVLVRENAYVAPGILPS
jgi:hypothetical protein